MRVARVYERGSLGALMAGMGWSRWRVPWGSLLGMD